MASAYIEAKVVMVLSPSEAKVLHTFLSAFPLIHPSTPFWEALEDHMPEIEKALKARA